MKNFIMASFAFASLLGFGQDSDAINQANPVRVQAAFYEVVGSGFPSTKVTVRSTFSNSCVVPRPSELVAIPHHSNQFDELHISLGSRVMRMCPMVYKPVTVTLTVGTYTRPNDGLFRKITVNGVLAQPLNQD